MTEYSKAFAILLEIKVLKEIDPAHDKQTNSFQLKFNVKNANRYKIPCSLANEDCFKLCAILREA